MHIKNTTSPSFQPVTLSVTFETKPELDAFMRAVGNTSQNERARALAQLWYPRVAYSDALVVAKLLGEMFHELPTH